MIAGKLYEIIDNVNNNRYIGSTSQIQLSNRISSHRTDFKKWLNGKTNNCGSYEILKNDNWTYYLLENYPCNDKEELRSRERYYIELRVEEGFNVVNKQIPNRKEKEYNKHYYNQNKEKIN